MRSVLAVPAVLAVLLSAPLAAQLPLGPEIVVTPEPVFTGSLAANQDGSFEIGTGTTGRFFTAADTLAGIKENTSLLATRGNGYVDLRQRRQDGHDQIVARLLDVAGQPVSPEILLVDGGRLWSSAGDPAGGFFVAWKDGELGPNVRRFDAQGNPAGPIVRVPESQIWDLAPLPGGGFAVAGLEHERSSSNIFARAYRPDGALAGPKTLVATGIQMNTSGVQIATDGLGRIVAVWSTFSPEDGSAQLRGQRLDASGQLLGPAFVVSEIAPGTRGFSWTHDVAARTDGSFLVLWGETDLIVCGGPGVDPCIGRLPDDNGDTWARAYDSAGGPLGPAFQISDSTERHQEPGLLAAFPGGWIASWTTTAGPATGLRVRRIFSPGCGGTAPALCLQGRRFRAEVTWHVPATGTRGTGAPIPFADDSGAFWFFSAANQELVVKVLDGRGVNGHFWVFFGSLTDVEFDLTVTDTLTGQRRTYHNPAGTMASRADTEAF